MDQEIKKLSYEEIFNARPGIDEVKTIKRFPITVIAENIRSLYNVGSIFRTSDGSLIEKLYLCGYTGYPPRKEIDKTALGSVDSVPWVHHEDPVDIARKLKDAGYHITALEHTSGSRPYNECDYTFPQCIVIGNKVEGVSEELLSCCDSAIEIPMYGLKQSLNVAVAYGIISYHLVEYYLTS